MACLHSEQALFAILLLKPEVVEGIVKKLISKIPGGDSKKYKIAAFVLNIYSERYMCQDCQSVAMAFQKNGAFLKMLTDNFEKSHFILKSSRLPWTIAVSSDQPFKCGKPDYDVEECRFTEDDHFAGEIDLRAMSMSYHLFFKDFSKKDAGISTFSSGKIMYPIDKNQNHGDSLTSPEKQLSTPQEKPTAHPHLENGRSLTPAYKKTLKKQNLSKGVSRTEIVYHV